MRFFGIFLVLLVASFSWAMWQGIDMVTRWAIEAVEIKGPERVLDRVEITAAEQSVPLRKLAPDVDAIADAAPGPRRQTAGTVITLVPAAQDPGVQAPGEVDAAPETTSERPASIGDEPGLVVSEARRVIGNQVNLRQGPGVGTDSLGLLSLNEMVEVLEVGGDWILVRTPGGEEGWVAARFLGPSQR